MPSMRPTILEFATVVSIFSTAVAQISYANDFVDPGYILAGNFGPQTALAQANIISWANQFAVGGPWSVMNKTITPPSGDKHDYMSWAPYWWPDCSGVGNKTALTQEQIWVTCPYQSRDGQFNPDIRLVNDVGDFQSLSDAVFYNSMAWALKLGADDKATFEANAVRFLRVWFLDADTKMNPNLNYAQMERGPDGQIGSHTGVLDLKCMAKITTGILILRKGGSAVWTSDLDNQMIAWTNDYLTWLETAKIAIEESQATNNHGSFYYNQLAALRILVNDLTGAETASNSYFDTLYMAQIAANGEQPFEAVRTRPYHYRAYNLAAMITNARLAKYTDPTSTVWNKTTTAGATIKTALDFAMTINASSTGESNYTDELYPHIAAVASVYGDADGKYLAFMNKVYPGFTAEPFILWDQPWAQNQTSGLIAATNSTSSTSSTFTGQHTSTSSSMSQNSNTASAALALRTSGARTACACVSTVFVGIFISLL